MLAVECLFAIASPRSRRERTDEAMAGMLLVNEAIGHLRATSKAQITAVILAPPPEHPPEPDAVGD